MSHLFPATDQSVDGSWRRSRAEGGSLDCSTAALIVRLVADHIGQDIGSRGFVPSSGVLWAGNENDDGFVNAADYSVWRNHLGKSVLFQANQLWHPHAQRLYCLEEQVWRVQCWRRGFGSGTGLRTYDGGAGATWCIDNFPVEPTTWELVTDEKGYSRNSASKCCEAILRAAHSCGDANCNARRADWRISGRIE
jgi:hypothetical protein